ncbi:MAG: hypothetical protein MJ252_05910, partial [archaeon]|nr:hypothetical protein [archaeon]
MDNANFLSYFKNITEPNSKETILKNATDLVNSINLHSDKKISSLEKYNLYLKICKDPSEDFLYTLRRLIGGISGSGLEMRKGFGLALSLFLDKFNKDMNMSELLLAMQKECIVQKNEKNHIKICGATGKILLYKIALNQKKLTWENLIFILKDCLSLNSNNLFHESIFLLIDELFNKIFSDYYNESIKTQNKFYISFKKIIEKEIQNKNNLTKVSSNFEFCLYFIMLKYKEQLKDILPNNILNELFDIKDEINSSLKNYFKILLTLPVIYKLNSFNFNVSFTFLCDLLEKLKNNQYAYKIWNILINNDCSLEFNKISSKNYELLLFKYSYFLIDKCFHFDYVKEIFDDSFFISFLQFNSNKKYKYVYDLVELLTSKLKELLKDDNNKEELNEYCAKLINIFGIEKDQKFSPNSLKNFFTFLYSNLSKEEKKDYIKTITSDSGSIDELIFKISALKNLYLSSLNLSQKTKDKIIDFFLINFYNSSPYEDLEFDNIIGDRTMLIILSLIKPNYENGEIKPLKLSKSIQILKELHGKIQNLIKNKKIIDVEENEEEEMEEDEEIKELKKKYNKYFKILTANEKEEEKVSLKEKLIIQLGLVLLVLYLKNPELYQQEMDEIIEAKNLGKEWSAIFVQVSLGMINKGYSIVGDFVMNVFKKISKSIEKDGVEVILDFLKDTKIR